MPFFRKIKKTLIVVNMTRAKWACVHCWYNPKYFMLTQCLEIKARGCCMHVFLVPEPTARSAVRRGLLIPPGYLHPGKRKHYSALHYIKVQKIRLFYAFFPKNKKNIDRVVIVNMTRAKWACVHCWYNPKYFRLTQCLEIKARVAACRHVFLVLLWLWL